MLIVIVNELEEDRSVCGTRQGTTHPIVASLLRVKNLSFQNGGEQVHVCVGTVLQEREECADLFYGHVIWF